MTYSLSNPALATINSVLRKVFGEGYNISGFPKRQGSIILRNDILKFLPNDSDGPGAELNSAKVVEDLINSRREFKDLVEKLSSFLRNTEGGLLSQFVKDGEEATTELGASVSEERVIKFAISRLSRLIGREETTVIDEVTDLSKENVNNIEDEVTIIEEEVNE